MVRLGGLGTGDYALETTKRDGSPQTFDVDSVMLDRRTGLGLYFVTYGTADLSRALDAYPRLRLVAKVRRMGWSRFSAGRRGTPPGIVLSGTAGRRRAATPEEAAKWRTYAVGRTINGHVVREEPNLYVRELRFQSASITLDEAPATQTLSLVGSQLTI